MTWFRVEDTFGNHPKVNRAGNAAVGLWVRCATYSAQHLTDGRIPPETVRGYGKAREIQALIDAGLWVENGSGFVIPDYLDYNPSRAEVLERRAADRERKRRRASGQGRSTDTGRFL